MHLQHPEPMMPEIPQCRYSKGGIELILVGDKGLDVVALGCIAGVLGGDDDLFDCAVPAEVAIPGDDLHGKRGYLIGVQLCHQLTGQH